MCLRGKCKLSAHLETTRLHYDTSYQTHLIMKAGLAYIPGWGRTNLLKYALTKNDTPGMEH